LQKARHLRGSAEAYEDSGALYYGSKPRHASPAEYELAAYSIFGFCLAHGLSRRKLYYMLDGFSGAGGDAAAMTAFAEAAPNPQGPRRHHDR
jgi:hypothetical protein